MLIPARRAAPGPAGQALHPARPGGRAWPAEGERLPYLPVTLRPAELAALAGLRHPGAAAQAAGLGAAAHLLRPVARRYPAGRAGSTCPCHPDAVRIQG
jgi:hypothetical protein